MKELSLNILDIAMNSVKAGAADIRIGLEETADSLTITITDNGCGMSPDFLASVTDPFTTTRTTRKVGLGIPLFKLAAEQTGGDFRIESSSEKTDPTGHGTEISARFDKTSIDFTPLGDVISTVTTLIQGSPDRHWTFEHTRPDGDVSLDTDELKAVLGDVPLSEPEVVAWIGAYLQEQYDGVSDAAE